MCVICIYASIEIHVVIENWFLRVDENRVSLMYHAVENMIVYNMARRIFSNDSLIPCTNDENG